MKSEIFRFFYSFEEQKNNKIIFVLSAFQKFDDISKQLENKDELIKSLQNKIEKSENENKIKHIG